MSKPFTGTINIDVRDSTHDWGPYEQPEAPDGAPNVMFIVWGRHRFRRAVAVRRSDRDADDAATGR